MYTEIELPYGDTVVKARIPTKNIVSILRAKEEKGLSNETEAIIGSLREPIGCPALRELVKKDDKVVVIVTDNTRSTPNQRLLPPLLGELETRTGRENITILVALGLHAPLDRAQLVNLLGKHIVENYRVLNHDVDQTVNIGTTSRGTPVDIDARFLEADFRIGTGLIHPHFFAGFSGGRKCVAPGVFSVHAAYKNHSFSMIDHPCARAGVLKGNPVHEDMVEQARMARLDFIVNVLVNRHKEITHVVAGDFILAHEKGCDLEMGICGTRVNRKADITITSSGGAPSDLDLYQTVKGIDNASVVTRDGGIIIIASCCNCGIGPEAFRELHASVKSPKAVLQKIRREEPIGVQWQNQILARAQLRNDIYLLSSLDDSLLKHMMVTSIRSVEAGLSKAFKTLGDDAEIIVVPDGPGVSPLME